VSVHHGEEGIGKHSSSGAGNQEAEKRDTERVKGKM
jgi:hypothetical protein